MICRYLVFLYPCLPWAGLVYVSSCVRPECGLQFMSGINMWDYCSARMMGRLRRPRQECWYGPPQHQTPPPDIYTQKLRNSIFKPLYLFSYFELYHNISDEYWIFNKPILANWWIQWHMIILETYIIFRIDNKSSNRTISGQEDKAITELTWRQRKFLQNRRLQMLDHQRHLKWISTSAIVWSHKEDGRHQYLQTVEIIQHILIGITQLQSIFDILEIFVCAPTFSGWGKWATWAGHWIPRLMRRW